ncbi:unnamed protein product [Lactuca saligna]|uniref:Uncharacterized protein n=1 Tax=Lactuca saligna TaxID=75948 RepID=A0AA36A655_LACSI|nr:unnamed protein product [Lactuca saligna]
MIPIETTRRLYRVDQKILTCLTPHVTIDQIMMEADYMLSYGVAKSSICLLHKYHILEILLPFQVVYISRQPSASKQSSMMLMGRQIVSIGELLPRFAVSIGWDLSCITLSIEMTCCLYRCFYGDEKSSL